MSTFTTKHIIDDIIAANGNSMMTNRRLSASSSIPIWQDNKSGESSGEEIPIPSDTNVPATLSTTLKLSSKDDPSSTSPTRSLRQRYIDEGSLAAEEWYRTTSPSRRIRHNNAYLTQRARLYVTRELYRQYKDKVRTAIAGYIKGWRQREAELFAQPDFRSVHTVDVDALWRDTER